MGSNETISNSLQGETQLKKAMYTILEAAALLSCSIAELVHDGAEGKLELYIDIPDEVELYNVGRSDLDSSSEPYYADDRPQPFRTSNVDFLLLPPSACKMILKAGFCQQGVYTKGGAVGSEGNLEYGKPPCPFFYKGGLASYSGIDAYRRYFATYHVGLDAANLDEFKYPKKVKIASDHLLVSRQSVHLLLTQRRQASFEVTKHVPLVVRSHTSESLLRLHKLFTQIWSLADRPGFKLPTRQEIVKMLIEEHSFSENQAKSGALAIEEAKLLVASRTGQRTFAALIMKKMISCSDEHWAPTSDRPSPNPSRETIACWFEKECHVPHYQGKVLASIIRPVSAPKGRRPNESPD